MLPQSASGQSDRRLHYSDPSGFVPGKGENLRRSLGKLRPVQLGPLHTTERGVVWDTGEMVAMRQSPFGVMSAF